MLLGFFSANYFILLKTLPMKPTPPAPGEQNPDDRTPEPPKKESKFSAIIKKIGFNIWLAVMVIGGALAFITALFLL